MVAEEEDDWRQLLLLLLLPLLGPGSSKRSLCLTSFVFGSLSVSFFPPHLLGPFSSSELNIVPASAFVIPVFFLGNVRNCSNCLGCPFSSTPSPLLLLVAPCIALAKKGERRGVAPSESATSERRESFFVLPPPSTFDPQLLSPSLPRLLPISHLPALPRQSFRKASL